MAASSSRDLPLPCTPRFDPPAAPDKPPRDRRRAREVSSRYMTHLPPPSPSANLPHPLPPPTRKKAPKSTPHHHPSPQRRSSSVERQLRPSSETAPFGDDTRRRRAVPPDFTDSDSDCSAFGDENLPRERSRAVFRLFSDDQRLPPEDPKCLMRKPKPLTPMTRYPERAVSNTPSAAGRSNLFGRRVSTQVARPLKEVSLTPKRQSTSSGEAIHSDGPLDPSSPRDPGIGELEESETSSIGSHGGWCESPPIRVQGSRVRSTSEYRSSMPGAERIAADVRSLRTPSLCNRSLNSALSKCEQSAFAQTKAFLKPQQLNQTQKAVNEAKKAKKDGRRIAAEDVHALRMLDNRYLQWRLVNARARATDESRRIAAERDLHALNLRLQELRNSVAAKRIIRQKMASNVTAYNILEFQMVYLDQWNDLEVEYSDSISGVTKALQDACLRLPVSGDIKVDVKALDDVFGSATKIMDAISPPTSTFLPQATRIQEVAAELAAVVSAERDLILQCDALLSEVQMLQVADCSLRSHKLQLKESISLSHKQE